MTKHECSQKVRRLKVFKTDEELAKLIGISKPTLYVRLKTNNWKITEISHIKTL